LKLVVAYRNSPQLGPFLSSHQLTVPELTSAQHNRCWNSFPSRSAILWPLCKGQHPFT